VRPTSGPVGTVCPDLNVTGHRIHDNLGYDCAYSDNGLRF
jgi:hypothetical protein